MTKRAIATRLLCAGIAIAAGCAPRPYYGYNQKMSDREAWEIVRRDPCRYDDYRQFAQEHKNPEKRRSYVWRLAHEGCSRERQYNRDQQDDGGYYNGYR